MPNTIATFFEHFLGRLKEYYRIGTLYDKTATYYLAMARLGPPLLFTKVYVIKEAAQPRLSMRTQKRQR